MKITQSSSGRKTRGAFFVARQPQKTVDGRPWGVLDRNLTGQNMAQWRPNEAKAPTQEETCMRILPELSDAMKIAAQGIVGSAIIKLLEKYGKDAPEQVGAYVKSMKDAVREV